MRLEDAIVARTIAQNKVSIIVIIIIISLIFSLNQSVLAAPEEHNIDFGTNNASEPIVKIQNVRIHTLENEIIGIQIMPFGV